MKIQYFDTVIVGAGLSGIGAAYHMQMHCPERSYVILEARSSVGGTWDLFRYPGIRSDSDMHTLGYAFRPWKESKVIADGPSILRYVKDTAKEYGIDRHIQFNQKLLRAEWSQDRNQWTLRILNSECEKGHEEEYQEKYQEKYEEEYEIHCHFLLMCAGYYDFEKGYTPDYPGFSHYQGQFIHPQHWDPTADYSGKNVVVIGSGATAISLVPELAKKAKKVVMLQRSPSYILSLPSIDPLSEFLKRRLPEKMAYRTIRQKNIFLASAFYKFCRRFPGLSRKLLLRRVQRVFGKEVHSMKHFSPNYDPWLQRLCIIPDGDLFKSIRSGKVEVVTDSIKHFVSSGISLTSGRSLEADLIVSATGLQLKFLGGIRLKVNGQSVSFADVIPYKGAMLSGVPNFGMAFGYTNASWTLKCDLTSEWLAKLLNHMKSKNFTTVTPHANPAIERMPLVDFSSGYFQRSKKDLPLQGSESPWKMHQNYLLDWIDLKMKPIADQGLDFC